MEDPKDYQYDIDCGSGGFGVAVALLAWLLVFDGGVSLVRSLDCS